MDEFDVTVPGDARCAVCGQADQVLLSSYPLEADAGRVPVVLCRNHAAPLHDARTVEIPTRSELLDFWAERRSRIVWLSRERRERPRSNGEPLPDETAKQ